MKQISFKLIFRSWWRNKIFTIISILSLAVGIACTNLLIAFVIHEYNIEGGNPNKDRIVVAKVSMVNDGMSTYHMMNQALVSELCSNVSQLDRLCRVCPYEFVTYCQVGENQFNDFKVVESDSTFLQFFPQKLVKGNLDDLLVGPDRIILTESFAERLFGLRDPIGQTIQIQFGMDLGSKTGLLVPFTISAVVKDNHQAAVGFDALFYAKPRTGLHFFLLNDKVSISDLESRADRLTINRNGMDIQFSFHSIREACFDKGVNPPPPLKKPNIDLLLIALFSAFLILIIACFNYVNLSFSRVFKQIYSIHVQKLMGAGIRQLSMQLFVDTCMTVGLGFLIAQLIQFDLLSIMNSLMSVQVPVSFLYTIQVLPVTFAFIFLLACIPAFYMSQRLPEMSISMYNNFYRGKARQQIITFLSVLQFVISFILIIGSLTVRQQISLLYEKVEVFRNVYTFSVGDHQTSMALLKERVALLPGIQAVALGSPIYHELPPLGEAVNGVYETYTFEQGDDDIIDVTGYKFIEGIPWKEAIKQYPKPIYLNRTWAQSLFPSGIIPHGSLLVEYEPGLKGEMHPVEDDCVIAGVVEDFVSPYKSNTLESPVGKGIITYASDGPYLKVRIDPENTSVIKQIYEEWDSLFPGKYLEHESLYAKVLGNNQKLFEMSDLLMMYGMISLMLICFGVFGMSLYAIEQRTKEIGIRKVNGASTWQIIWLLNRRFILWIGLAYVIAVPAAWWLLNRWMENFVFRTGFSIWTYFLPLVVVTAITLLTVSWQSFKAAAGNPIDALRDE